jgi:hypothetical protein
LIHGASHEIFQERARLGRWGALTLSQTASAAPVRAGTPIAESEALGESAGATPLIAAFAVFLVTGLVILLTDDDDDSPVSP